MPYYDEDKDELIKKILYSKNNANNESEYDVSSECKDFLEKIIEHKYKERLGFKKGAKEILSHSWFSNIDFDDYESVYDLVPEKYINIFKK